MLETTIYIGSAHPCVNTEYAGQYSWSQLRADFAYLHQPYQDMGTLGDWEAKFVSEIGTVLTETFLKPQFFS